MSQESTTKTICCPEFDPIPWDGKVFEWKNKKFIKDSVFTIFYMPMELLQARFTKALSAIPASGTRIL